MHRMTIEYLKCRADLNFEVDFGAHDSNGRIVTLSELILFKKWIVFTHNTIFFGKRILCL